MEIRKFQDTDARELSTLIRRTLRISLCSDYDAATLDQFINLFSPSAIRDLSRYHHVFVVEENGQLVATGSLCDNKVTNCYVDPLRQKQGLGSKLVKNIEKLAKREGHSRLRVHASPSAVPFYRHHGYRRSPKQPEADAYYIVMTKKLD